MNGIYWAMALAAAVFGLYYTGRRKQLRMQHIDDKVLAEFKDGEVVGQLVYHGGMPQRPKPASLMVGVLADSLLLWDYCGGKNAVAFASWSNCEKLTMETRPNARGLPVTLLGPLIFLFTRPKVRYFIVIKYRDCNQEENNILFECPAESIQRQVYDILHSRWQRAQKAAC